MGIANIGKEDERVEFKKSTGELKEGIISIASILNKHGAGELYFGVKNNGDVVGQEISDSTLREISHAISNHIYPAIYPEVTVKTFEGRNVAFVGFSGNRSPYLAYNVPRIRVADEDIIMDQETYDEMLRSRGDASKAWECQVSDQTVDDVIEDDFKEYLRRAKEVGRIDFGSDDPNVVMEKLNLVADDGIHLLNAEPPPVK